MAKLTYQEFQAKYYRRFADNEIQNITEATFREWTLDMIDSFASRGTGSNDIPGAPKLVIYQTKADSERAGFPQRTTLEGLKNTSIACGNLGRIDVTPTGPVWLEAVYDNGQGPYPYGPGFYGLLDGSALLDISGLPSNDPAKRGLAKLKWVLKDSPEALEARTANIQLYKAGTNYRGNDLVRQVFGSHATGFKTIVFSSNESGTDIPAPSRPEGDAYWSVFIPPPVETFPWQTVTPAELRQLKATAKLSAGRLYIVSPRPIPDDPQDNSKPDLFIRALMETELEPTGWLLVGADDKQLVNYDLATDTTTPVEYGGASTFGELGGLPRDNAPLAEELDAYTGARKPFAVIDPTGKLTYYSAWLDMAEVPAGSEIHLRGAYGNPNLDYPALNDHRLILEPGSIFSCRRYFAHTSGAVGPDGWRYRTIEGSGTFRGLIQWYGAPGLNLVVRDIRHEGRFEHNSFSGPTVGTLGAKLFVQNVTAAPLAGQSYFTGFHRNGGFYTSWFQADFLNCKIDVKEAPAFYLYSLNNDATIDTEGKANNRLRAVGCTFTGDGANAVLGNSSGTATYQFAFNSAYNIAIPTEELDPNFLAFGVGGGISSTPGGPSYTDEQVQDAVARLLAAGTHQGITFTYDDAGNALSATVTATGQGNGSSVTVLDVYAYSQAKRTQVFGLFTSPSQFKAVDVALAGDTSTRIGSRIPDLRNGGLYELVADPDNPMPGPEGTPIGTPTWLRR